MIEYLESQKEDFLQQIKSFESKIEDAPEGTLQIYKEKDVIKYVNVVDKKRFYIGRNKELIYKLALKKYCNYHIKRLSSKISTIETCINILSKSSFNQNNIDFSDKYPEYFKLIKPTNITTWENESFASTAGYSETLKVLTSKGIKVRSKSEAIIVEALSSTNIPFRYECDLEFFGRTLHPDFTIKRPRDGKIIIWEHFGLLDESGYRNNAINKLQTYSSAGYVVGDNLIITYETRERPFSYKKAIETINEFILH